MDASNIQNFMCKVMKIWCQTCLFCVKKYPTPLCIVVLFFLLYVFFPSVFTFVIYSFPLVGFLFFVHRVFLGIRHQKTTQIEQDDRRRKFAKSRRSFKSIYGDRRQLIRRNAKEQSDNHTDMRVGDKDTVFLTSFNDLLVDKTALIEENPKEIREVINVESVGRVECSSSNDSQSLKPGTYGRSGESSDSSEDEDDEPQDKAVQWTENDRKNVMDLGILETERNKRLESLIERRRSRKFASFKDKTMENNSKGQMSAIQIPKVNPFLEDNSTGKNTPGSAPSSLLPQRNPFDLPYGPHEEKPNLSGDSFGEEFTVGHQKEPVFCRHQSFTFGAFIHPEIANDEGMSFYNDFANKQRTVDYEGDDKHVLQDSPISDDSFNGSHCKAEGESSERVVEDGNETKTEEMGSHHNSFDAEENNFQRVDDSYYCRSSTTFDERKADINFFYGGNKRVCHAPSDSIVSDLQVEVSDDDESSSLHDGEAEKGQKSWLNSSNPYDGHANESKARDVHMVNEQYGTEIGSSRNEHNPLESNLPAEEINEPDADTQQRNDYTDPLHDTKMEVRNVAHEMQDEAETSNADMVESHHLDELSGVSQTAPDGSTEVTDEQAPITSCSPKSVLQPAFSNDQPSSSNFADELANEPQQSSNHTSEVDSLQLLLPDSLAESGLHQTSHLGENPFSDRDPENLQVDDGE